MPDRQADDRRAGPARSPATACHDGTMVVVDQGKRALGRTIEVTVTSVLQTTAGKMIFCRWPEAQNGGDGETHRRSHERRGHRGDRRTEDDRARDSDSGDGDSRQGAEVPSSAVRTE